MIQRSPLVSWGTIGDDLLLWSVEDRRLHVLNSTAANAWLLTDEATTLDAMVEKLAISYGVDADGILDDVTGLIERFLAAGLCVASDRVGQRPPPVPLENAPPIDRSNAVLGPFMAMGVRLLLDIDDELLGSELSRILDLLCVRWKEFGT